MEDAAYLSPSSDGHPSIPSPSDTTHSFRRSRSPRRFRTLTSSRARSPASSDHSTDDDDLVITVSRPGERPRVSSSVYHSERRTRRPRVLEPTGINSSPPRVLSRMIHGKNSTENIDPNAPRAAPRTVAEDAEDDTDKEALQPQSAATTIRKALDNGYSQKNLHTSPISSTPDPLTGLTKRIVVRKTRYSPKKDAAEDIRAVATGSDADDEQGPYKRRTSLGKGNDGRLSNENNLDPFNSRNIQARNPSALSRATFRSVSENTDTGSIFQHETLEQIDHSALMSSKEPGTPPVPSNAHSLITPPTSQQEEDGQKNLSDMIQELSSKDPVRQNSLSQSVDAIITVLQNNSAPQNQLKANKSWSQGDYFELPFTPTATRSSSSGDFGQRSQSVSASKTTEGWPRKTSDRAPTIQSEDTVRKSSRAPSQGVEASNTRTCQKENTPDPSELDIAFPDTTPKNETSNRNNRSDNPYNDTPLASSTPKFIVTPKLLGGQFDLMRLKQSRSARRMSMNTPPSSRTSRPSELNQSLPSTLSGSEYRFPAVPLRYDKWNPAGVPREFSPILGTEKSSSRMNGTDAPPNSTTATPVPSDPLSLPDAPVDMKRRERSMSDPLGGRVEKGVERMLFTPSRIDKPLETESVENRSTEEPTKLKSSFSTDSGTSDRDMSYLDDVSLHDGEGEYPSDDGNERRLWSGFSQEFPTNYHFHEVEAPIPEGREPSKSQESSQSRRSNNDASLSLENVEVRVQTPSSVTNRGRNASGNTVVTAPSQNDDQKTSVENYVHSVEARARLKTSPSISPISSSHLPGPEINEVLRHQASELAAMRGRETGYRSEISDLRKLVSDWQYNYQRAQSATGNHQRTVESLERRLGTVENELLEKQRAEDLKNGNQENDAGDRLAASKMITALEQKFAANEQFYRNEIAERNQTIGHLKAALEQKDQRPSIEDHENAQGTIDDLQTRLVETEEAHQANVDTIEAKYKHILWERQSMINHLQAELDEMANLMPVDHGNHSRTTEGADSWQEDRSREISLLFGEHISHILIEVHGNVEGDDYDDEAAAVAESSLRKLAQAKGYEPTMDKLTLAAFGIRELRVENDILKKLLVESEGRVKDLMEVNRQLGDREEDLNGKSTSLQDEIDGMKRAAAASEQTFQNLIKEVEVLERNIAESDTQLARLKAENQRLSSANERANAAESEKTSLQVSLFQMKGQVETWKSQSVGAEQQAHGFREEIEKLRNDLAESTSQHIAIESGFRVRVTELQQTLSRTENQKTGLEKQLEASKQRILEQEGLVRQLRQDIDIQQQSPESDDRLPTEIRRNQDLEERLAKAVGVADSLRAENSILKNKVAELEAECRVAKGRFTTILHEIAGKEAQWETQRSTLENQLQQQVQQTGGTSQVPAHSCDDALARILEEFAPDTRKRLEEHVITTLAEQLQNEQLPHPNIVATVVLAIRLLYSVYAQAEAKARLLDDKNQRLKAAIKRWGSENANEKDKVGRLVEENSELALRLKAEKKQADEKIGQLILALRR